MAYIVIYSLTLTDALRIDTFVQLTKDSSLSPRRSPLCPLPLASFCSGKSGFGGSVLCLERLDSVREIY